MPNPPLIAKDRDPVITGAPARPVGIAVIGTGYWGPQLARNVAASPMARMAGLCDVDAARLDEIGQQYPAAPRHTDLEQVLADPNVEAVAIATPFTTHFDLARAALEAGKHVLVEKPFTSSSHEARELIAQAARRRLVLMVDHVFLYSSAVTKLIEVYREGTIGVIQFIDGVRINLGQVRHDINVLWDLAPHDLSIVDGLLGRSPIGAVATGPGSGGNGQANVAYVHLDYGAGLQVSLHVSWLSPVKIRHFLVGGTRGSMVYNDLDPSEPLKIYDRGVTLDLSREGEHQRNISYRWGDVLSPDVGHAEPLRTMIEHFAACIRDGVSPRSGGEQGLRLVKIIEAADRSLSQHGEYVAVADD